MKKSSIIKWSLCLVLALGLGWPVKALDINMDSARVSLITCSPGKMVYERFGHTALRVQDPSQGIDLVFNYGLFDFNKSGFYLKFVRGETDYLLGAYEFHYFLPEYVVRNSSVWQQDLNLNKAEKERLIKALLVNHQPENREYRYNFIFDNCATRPRDLIEYCLDEPIVLSPDSVGHTFRYWVRQYVGYHTWPMVGIDIIFGTHADRVATRREAMFLPEVLMQEYGKAGLAHSGKPLVSGTEALYERTHEAQVAPLWLSLPWVQTVLALLVVLGLSLLEWRLARSFRWLDTLVLLVYGLIGVVVFFLMCISSHPMVHSNFNLLWLNPLHLLAIVLLWVPKLRKCYRYYMMLVSVLCVATVLAYVAGWQVCHPAGLALLGILLVRAVVASRARVASAK